MAVSIQDLKQFELFRGFTPEQLEALVSICRREEYDSGATILSEGAQANAFYAIEAGRVAIEMRVQFGERGISRQATTQLLRGGQYLGWSTLVPPYTYTGSAISLEPSTLLVFDGDKLRELADQDHHLGYRFMQIITRSVATHMMRTNNILIHTLSIMSHDLKAPLVAVRSYLEVISGGFAGPVNDDQQEMLERSMVRVDELLILISDILDVSRIETGRLGQEFEPMSLIAVARAALADIEGAARDKNMSVSYAFPEGDARMVGAAGRLHQVLNNLLSNAVKYSEAGGQIKLSIRSRDDQWEVEVSDTGIGIPAQDLPYIFRDFFRATNADAPGSGLGLAIAKKIVDAHDGRIWVESPCRETGRGSRFTFTLPKNLKPYIPESKEEAKP